MAVLISLGESNSEQKPGFAKNCSHSVNDELNCSLSITPKYPEHIKTEKDAAQYLIEQLSALSCLGWVVEAQIGKSND